MNIVILQGAIGKAPEIRSTHSGKKVCEFSLATNKSVKVGDKWENKTEWHSIVVWGNIAEYLVKNSNKGSQILIHGEISYSEYTTKEGEKSKKTIITANSLKIFPRAPISTGNEKEDIGAQSEAAKDYCKETNNGDDDLPF